MSDVRTHTKSMGIVCVMMTFFFSQAITAIYPIQELLTTVFPNVSAAAMTYASTIVTVASLASLLFLGSLVGRKISYKATAIMGFLFYGVGGALPFFIPTFPMILVGRAILGLGTGALQLLGAPLLTNLIADDAKRAKFTGVGSFICYCGSCGVSLISGLVATVDWKFSFLIHLVALLGIFVVLFGMDEPTFSESDDAGDAPAEKEGFFATAKKIPGIVWVMMIGNGLVAMLCMMVDLSSSYVLADMGASLEVISVAVSLAYVGYASGGLLYIPLNTIMKQFTLPAAAAIAIIGQLICYFSATPILFIVGSIICCAGYTVSFTTVMYNLTVVSDKSSVALVNSFLMVSMSFFAFFSSPFYGLAISVTGDPIKGQFVFSLVGLVILMIVFCFARVDKIKPRV